MEYNKIIPKYEIKYQSKRKELTINVEASRRYRHTIRDIFIYFTLLQVPMWYIVQSVCYYRYYSLIIILFIVEHD